MSTEKNRFESLLASLSREAEKDPRVAHVFAELEQIDKLNLGDLDQRDMILNLPYSGAKPIAGMIWK